MDENDHGPVLPRWIEEYQKCLTLPHRRERRAAIAISMIGTEKGAVDAVAPRRLYMRPLDIRPPKRELECTKASEWIGDPDLRSPITPPTPSRRRPPKLGRPKAELASIKPRKDCNKTRRATPNGPGHAVAPKPGQTKADVASNGMRSQDATSEGPRTRFPTYGSPKESAVHSLSEFSSAKEEISTVDIKFQSAKAKSRTPVIKLKSAEPETSSTIPEFGDAQPERNTTAPEPKEDRIRSHAVHLDPGRAQAEADMTIQKPHSAEAETDPAALESTSAKPETVETAPNPSKATEVEKEVVGDTTPGQLRPRPPKLGRPRAEAKPGGHNGKIETIAVNPRPDSITEEPDATTLYLGKPPEIETAGASDSIPDGQRPIPKLPKLGRSKAELVSQKPEKLTKKDEMSLPEKLYTDQSSRGNAKTDPGYQESKLDQAAKKLDQGPRDALPKHLSPHSKVKSSNGRITTPPKGRRRPAKLENSKAKLDSTTNNKVARKEGGTEESTLRKPVEIATEPKDTKSYQSRKETDETIRGIDEPIGGPYPDPPASEVDGHEDRDENTTPPRAKRAKPPKLGKSKVGLKSI